MSERELFTSRRIFAGNQLSVGQFDCPVSRSNFSDTGPIQWGPIIVFPRTGVEITYADRAPIVTDATTVMFYNEGQEYRRGKVSPYGDRCEWIAFAPELVYDVVRHFDPNTRQNERRLFSVTHGPCDANIYLEQRKVVEHILNRGEPDVLYVEEALLAILAQVVEKAYSARNLRSRCNRDTLNAHAGLAHEAKRLIANHFEENRTLTDIAGALYVSPFHLCRVFRQQCGLSLHHYRNQIRLRASLESISGGGDHVTDIALSLGYSSHSHFTSTFGKCFGISPSAFQRATAFPDTHVA